MSNNFIIFDNVSTAYIQNQNECIVTIPTLIYLPIKPVIGRRINIYNQTGKLISVDCNSKTDFLYSSFYAPNGFSRVTLENNRMMTVTYIGLQNNKKLGVWHVITS